MGRVDRQINFECLSIVRLHSRFSAVRDGKQHCKEGCSASGDALVGARTAIADADDLGELAMVRFSFFLFLYTVIFSPRWLSSRAPIEPRSRLLDAVAATRHSPHSRGDAGGVTAIPSRIGRL
jgi:hypothetical protein